MKTEIQMRRAEIQMRRAEVAKNHFNLELNKDFYELDPDEVNRLHLCYLASDYDGSNNMGRSKLRQFWYHLQKGWKSDNEGRNGKIDIKGAQ